MVVTELPAPRATHVPSAVAWIDEDSAIVARSSGAGAVSTCEITRGGEPEPSYLAIVVRAIGDRDRVVILGPSDLRVALERAYAQTDSRRRRLVIVERGTHADRQSVTDRLRTLVGEPAWTAS